MGFEILVFPTLVCRVNACSLYLEGDASDFSRLFIQFGENSCPVKVSAIFCINRFGRAEIL